MQKRAIAWLLAALMCLSAVMAYGEAAEDWAEPRYGRTNRTDVKIRDSDYSRAKIVAEMPEEGTMVLIWETFENDDGEAWHYVSADEYEGFVQAAYVDEFSYDDFEAYYGQTNEDGVRMRETAYSRGKIVAEITEAGTLVTVLDTVETNSGELWHYVQVEGYEGYVPAESIVDMYEDDYETYAASYAYTNEDGVRLRETAYSRGKIIAEITEAGTLVMLIDYETDSSGEGWYYVQVGGYEGYIPAETVDEMSDYDYEEMLETASRRERNSGAEADSGYCWVVAQGDRYHRNYGCSNMNGPWQITVEEAEDYYGLTPCQKCW